MFYVGRVSITRYYEVVVEETSDKAAYYRFRFLNARYVPYMAAHYKEKLVVDNVYASAEDGEFDIDQPLDFGCPFSDET